MLRDKRRRYLYICIYVSDYLLKLNSQQKKKKISFVPVSNSLLERWVFEAESVGSIGAHLTQWKRLKSTYSRKIGLVI